MRSLKCLALALLFCSMSRAAAEAPMTPNEMVDRIVAQEQVEMQLLRQYAPLVETYIQYVRPDKHAGEVPDGDKYFLGRAELAHGVVLESLNRDPSTKRKIFRTWGEFFTTEFLPAGFLQMIYLDTSGFNRQHYAFAYVGREFLGEVRCLVFDVKPLPKSGKGRFVGRIWVEDQDYHIVRFNGIYGGASLTSNYLDFDSWRMNAGKNLWLPAFVYSEGPGVRNPQARSLGFKAFRAQTRLWGFDPAGTREEQTLGRLLVEKSSHVVDHSETGKDYSPIQAERSWDRQAEDNVTDRLERQGLVAPPGEVDQVLETVVNNLEVTNNLDIQPEVHCRVLTTGTLEMFSIGHTIVLSRGLLDVLPDEASLATMLAQELADIIVTKPSTDQWGFNDMTNVSTVEALSHFTFKDSPEQVKMANDKAYELLKNSPYKDKLGNAGLFLKQMDAQSKNLPALINPRLGNKVFLAGQMMGSAPNLDPSKIDQIAALPIGARVKLDPWSDRVELLKAKAIPLLSAREKMPFEVTPFMPYLTRYQKPGTALPTVATKADMAKQQSQQQQQQQQQ